MFKLDRQFVIDKLKEIDSDDMDHHYELKSDEDLVADFCLSGLFNDFFNGDGVDENSLVGLYDDSRNP